MIINLNAPRDISYRILDTDNIKQIEYIVSFPSGYKHSFPVDLDSITGEVLIHLPITKDIISEEFDGMGYIKVTKMDGTIKELNTEVIRFVQMVRIDLTMDENKEVNFNKDFEPINSMALKNNEVVVSHSNTLQFIMSNVDRDKK